MKLVAGLAVIVWSAAIAHGDTSFNEDSGGMVVPSRQLFEAACDIDIDLRGAVAQVAVRQRIVNPGPDELASTYEVDLPPGATITGFSVKGDGAAEAAL